MRNDKRMGKGRIAVVAAAMAVALMGGSAVSHAMPLSDSDKFVRSSFSAGVGEASQDLEEEIVTDVDKKWNLIPVEEGTGISTREAGHLYKWTLRPLDTYEVLDIYREKGSTITVSCGLLGESGKYVVAGIIEPDCTARGVKDKDAVVHTFDIYETGYYSVFARNVNDSDIKVDFIYYL